MNERCEAVRDLAPGFVLGALTRDEEDLVRDHLATCPEPHPEFAELGGVVGYLADAVPPVEPPPALRARILAAAAADLEARRPAPIPFPTPDDRASRAADGRAQARERELAPGRRRVAPLAWVAGLAAVLAIAALGAWNLTLQRDLETAREYQRGLTAVLDLAGAPGSQIAILAPAAGGGPSGLAAVGADGRVVLVMRDLAPTTGTEVYAAWVIGGSGQPVAIGDLRVGATGTATFSASGAPVEAGVVVALTREPRPGATQPSGAPVSAGRATAAGA